jgi:predicted dehydrogenase
MKTSNEDVAGKIATPNSEPKTTQKSEPAPENKNGSFKKVRYALVALGNISQVAVLPGFLNATANSELVAFVSGDPKKLKKLAAKYKVKNCYSYEQYDDCLRSGKIDAVYISLPNNLHREYVVRAARAGIHVLCEKPLGLDERECLYMIRNCRENNVKLMTAYRLHFEQANLEAAKIIQSGKIGEPRFFNSLFSMQAKKGIRTSKKMGGGTLYDIGIYCINAARYLFRAEPQEAFAYSVHGTDARFKEVDEMTLATLRFPKDCLASFTCSFGAADKAVYEVVGTKGSLRMTQAYEFSEAMEMELTVRKKTTKRSFEKRDQFGPEIIYFSDCVLNNKEPEPSGWEGLRDVHIICSLYESAHKGHPIKLTAFQPRHKFPDSRQEIHRPARQPLMGLVHADHPHR